MLFLKKTFFKNHGYQMVHLLWFSDFIFEYQKHTIDIHVAKEMLNSVKVL